MKRVFLLAALVCFVMACKKNSGTQAENSSIVGKWKLFESLADPGDGSGTWHAADPLHPAYLEFKKDGIVTFTPANFYNADHYQVTSDTTMIFIRGSENFLMRYKFSKTLLTLYPPCIEACGQRYIAAE